MKIYHTEKILKHKKRINKKFNMNSIVVYKMKNIFLISLNLKWVKTNKNLVSNTNNNIKNTESSTCYQSHAFKRLKHSKIKLMYCKSKLICSRLNLKSTNRKLKLKWNWKKMKFIELCKTIICFKIDTIKKNSN